jgi:hypothetical protein
VRRSLVDACRGNRTGTEALDFCVAVVLDIATRAGGRYMGADRADEFGRRNGVPGELVVSIHPNKVTAAFDVVE